LALHPDLGAFLIPHMCARDFSKHPCLASEPEWQPCEQKESVLGMCLHPVMRTALRLHCLCRPLPA
jgi:hypothetical protein